VAQAATVISDQNDERNEDVTVMSEQPPASPQAATPADLDSEALVEALVSAYEIKESTEQRIKDLWAEFYEREQDQRVSIRYLATRMRASAKVKVVTFSSWNRRKLRALGMLKPRARD
jgi:hypothetical protein